MNTIEALACVIIMGKWAICSRFDICSGKFVPDAIIIIIIILGTIKNIACYLIIWKTPYIDICPVTKSQNVMINNLIIKWLAVPCYRVICMRKVTVGNFKTVFYQWPKNGCNSRTGSSFQVNSYLRKNRFMLGVSINHLIRTVEIQSQYKSVGIWKGDNILNIWRICLVKCAFRLLPTSVHCSPVVWNHHKQCHFFFKQHLVIPIFKHIGNTFILTTRLKCLKCRLARYC